MLGSLIASVIISWLTALYIWSRHPAPGAKQLAGMMGLVGWWGIPFLLRALDPGASTMNYLLQTLYQDRKLLCEKRDLTLTLQTPPELPPVNADPRLMEQVVTNLLANAINYTPSGGSINLSTAFVEAEQTAWVTLAVQDTGLGIPREEQTHIFERFHRGAASQVTRAPGTGLGLAIIFFAVCYLLFLELYFI